MAFLRTPTNVSITVSNLASDHVDYSISWVIDHGVHPGPYTVHADYSKDSATFLTLGIWDTSGDPKTSTTLEGAYNSTYRIRVTWYCADCDSDSAFGYSNTVASYSSILTDTITLTDDVPDYTAHHGTVATDTITMSDRVNQNIPETITDTVTMSDWVNSASTLKTDYGYFVADEAGDIFTYSAACKSWNGTAIQSYIKFKKTDFSDLYPKAANRINTCYRAKLTYVDKGVQYVTFSWSTDGWATSASLGKTIGTTAAPKITKVAYYDFVASSEFFNWKLECSSSTTDWQLIGLEFDFVIGGETYA